MPNLRPTLIAAFVAAAFLFTAGAQAELSRKDQKAARQMFKGTLYMRFDAPCTKGRHPYGVYLSPVVDVSPQGVNTETEGGGSFGWYHASTTVWAVRVNDPVEFDDISWEDDGTLEIELIGVGSADGRDTVLRFVNIQSLADFEAAWKLSFSTQPLQDEHPDWPADMRKAVGERRLVPGMNKRQTFYVVGLPEQVEKSKEGDLEIETWTLRKRGAEIGFFTYDPGDFGPAEKIRFEGGKLVTSSQHNPNKIDLDN